MLSEGVNVLEVQSICTRTDYMFGLCRASSIIQIKHLVVNIAIFMLEVSCLQQSGLNWTIQHDSCVIGQLCLNFKPVWMLFMC